MPMEDLIEVVSEMDDHLEAEVDPDLDQIEKWRDIINNRIKTEESKTA